MHATPDEVKNGGFIQTRHRMFSVTIKPEEFKYGGFTRITHQMFSIHATTEEFKNAKITGFLELFLRKTTRAAKSRDYRDVIVFEKFRFQNVFLPH